MPDRTPPPIAPEDFKRLWRERVVGFERFAAWQRDHPSARVPADAIAAAGWLYDQLPPGGHRRALDASGVIKLHRALRVL